MEKSESDLQLKAYDIQEAKDLASLGQKCQEEPDFKQTLEELVDDWSVFVSSIYDQYSLKVSTAFLRIFPKWTAIFLFIIFRILTAKLQWMK